MAVVTNGLVGVLLAAGKGSRFGSHKGLAVLPDGMPMALRSALNLQAALTDVVCVVRPDDRVLHDIFREHDFGVVVAENAALGMSASLQAGILAAADAKGWMLALADMPLIKVGTYQQLVIAFAGGPQFRGKAEEQIAGQIEEQVAGEVDGKIIVPCMSVREREGAEALAGNEWQRIGHPVIIPARFRQELLALSGDRGAKAVLARHSEQIQAVLVDDPGILQDFDTQQAFKRLFI